MWSYKEAEESYKINDFIYEYFRVQSDEFFIFLRKNLFMCEANFESKFQ